MVGDRPIHALGCGGYNNIALNYKTAALILLLTGIRRGELCGLEWSNINFEEPTITIARSITTVTGFGVVEKELKTESSKREIAISEKLIKVLGEYKEWYEQYKKRSEIGGLEQTESS